MTMDKNTKKSHSFEHDKWNVFINNLYDKFSEYGIQKEREKYDVADLSNWGSSGKKAGIKVTKDNIELFLSKISDQNIAEFESIKNTTLTEEQISELNHILDLTLKIQSKAYCEKNSIFIEGRLVLLSDLSKEKVIFKDESCKNVTLENFKYVSFFASNSIYFDEDISHLGKSTSIAAIAPKWEIVGKRRIELSGANGEPQGNNPKEPTPVRNKSKNGINGKDGKPGLPGRSGGNFFGIAEQFENSGNLTVDVNGGKGGWGQDGGDGNPGDDGKDAIMPKNNRYIHWSSESCGHENYCDDYFKKNDMVCKGSPITHWYTQNREGSYTLYGKEGGRGGNGGNGGKGGKGGKSGHIRLMELNDNSKISANSNEGENGNDGKGGKGGRGGYHGDDLEVTCTYVDLSGQFFINCESKFFLQKRIPHGREISGKIGTDGGNTVGMLNPEPKIDDIDAVIIINKYKNYLRESLIDNFRNPPLLKFLNDLDSNNKVMDVYDALGLVMDMNFLEAQLPELRNKVNFLPFYESLMKKISEYARQQTGMSMENKKVLSYLYTAVMSKIYTLKEDTESPLIVDIEGYLNIVKKNFEDLRDLQKAKYKKDIIERYNEGYQNHIDKKIDEAKYFIDMQIKPEISNVLNLVDSKIDSLIDETIELQKKAIEERKKLIDLKQKLVKSLESRSLLSLLGNLGQFISLLGPAGSVVGTITEQMGTIPESLDVDDQNIDISSIKLPKGVDQNLKFVREQIETMSKEKNFRLIKLLDQMSNEMKQCPDVLKDLLDKISILKTKLNNFQDITFNFQNVKASIEELRLAIKKKQKELNLLMKTREAPNYLGNKLKNQNEKDALRILDKFGKSLTLFGIGIDIYNNYTDGQEKLDVIINAIEESKTKYEKLKQYEERIFTLTLPMLKTVGDNMNDIASKLGTKSKVFLSVIRWQVQDALRDLKTHMRQLTKGFESFEDDLPRGIEKLEEVMTVLIDVYDSLQNYQEQKSLTKYIADISSVTANKIKISDEKLRGAVNNLDIGIKSNLILKQYEISVNSFKQFLFPLANAYLKEIPLNLELKKDVENLVLSASTEIDNMVSQIEMYKKSIRKYNKYLRTGEFKSNFVSTTPFYVWKNDKHKELISKLLSGQEVMLKADIVDSQPYKDAIKFSYIDLRFISPNITLQNKINEAMKAFEVRAVHSGNSYYRYKNKLYLLRSESQTIEFSLEKKSNEDPVETNDVYKMIKDGDFMLSPYTWWKFQLFNTTKNISFQNLSIFKEHIDLSLEGEGKYVYTRQLDFDLEVDKYYKAIDSMNYAEYKSTDRNFFEGFFTRIFKKIKHYIGLDNNEVDDDKTRTETGKSWFSWMSLPRLNIFPGAEAVVLEDNDFEKDGKDFLNDVMGNVYNIKESVKHAYVTDNNYSNLPHVERERYTGNQPLSIDYFKNEKDLIDLNETIDLTGNLLLGLLVANKISDGKKFRYGCNYKSPEQMQIMKIDDLASEILPILMNCQDEDYTEVNRNHPSWFREESKNSFIFNEGEGYQNW